MSCKFIYKEKKHTKEELISVLSFEEDLVSKYLPQEERLRYEKEDLSVFNEKIDYLKKTMNVEVVMDDSIPSSRVLSSTDPRTVAAGKPVILINPEQIFNTTAIHEFAHIFVDALPGGVNNERFQKAFKELEGTDLYDEVKELYPELDDEMFAKELIVTAIGLEGADIWENEMNQSKWEAFKSWFIKTVKNIFGLSETEVISLTRELLDNSVKKDLIDNLSNSDQELRFVKDFKKEEKKADLTYEDIVSSIENLYHIRKPKSKEELKFEESQASLGKKTLFSSISEINEKLQKFNNADMAKGLFAYLKWSEIELTDIGKAMTRIEKKEGKLNEDDIKKFKLYNESYQLIEDVEKIIAKEYQAGNLSLKRKNIFTKAIALTKQKYSDAQNRLLMASRERFADMMLEHSNEHITEWREEYSKRYDAMEPDTPKEEWIASQMKENADFINEKAREIYMERAERSLSDISGLAAILFTEKNQNSEEIQIASMLMDKADFNTTQFALSEANKAKKHLDEFKKRSSGRTAESKYKKFIKQNKLGSYLISKYDSKFLEAAREKKETIDNVDYQKEHYSDLERKGLGFVYNDKDYELNLGSNVKNLSIEGEHVHYTLGKGTYVFKMPFHAAVAETLSKEWFKENTVKNGFSTVVPSDKWLDADYMKLTEEDIKDLAVFKDMINRADELYESKNSLIRNSYGAEFHSLPGVRKNSLIEMFKGNVKYAAKESFLNLFMKNTDDYEIGPAGKGKNKKDPARVYANINNEEKFEIPIAYRAQLSSEEQSLDLHTILFLNLEAAKNYEQKKKVENQIDVIIDVAEGRRTNDTGEFDNQRKVHAFSDEKDIDLLKSKKGMSNDVKKLYSMKENRIFGITAKGGNTAGGANVQKTTSSILKYAGRTALIGNWINSVVNATTGTVNNIIEAIGGDVYTLRDWAKAKEKYWRDIKGIADDMGSNVHTSRTNMFLNVFNVLGSREVLMNNFEENTRIQTLFKENSLRPLANAGEHMMQAQVMYAVMNNIKAMDSMGRFLDAKGNVVKERKNAASLDEVITFNKDKETGEIKMTLPDFVKATTFTHSGGHNAILLETRNLIKKKIIDLHGNYSTDLQSAAQREWWGKMAFFLRRWIESTTLRRWRGLPHVLKASDELTRQEKFYSQDTKSFEEGYYLTAVRFVLQTFVKGIKEHNFNVIKAHQTGVSKLSAKERANMRKFLAEMGMITLTLAAYTAMGGFDDEPDEETLVARYIFRRELSELTFYGNPLEAIKIASSPSAAINFSNRVFKAMSQLFSPTERYEQGKNKGELKLWIRTAKALPGFSQYHKDIEASLRFLSVAD